MPLFISVFSIGNNPTTRHLIDQGVDIVTISTCLGHSEPDITLRSYAHLFRKDDGKAAEAINATFKTIPA